jgi:hypothetical protein
MKQGTSDDGSRIVAHLQLGSVSDLSSSAGWLSILRVYLTRQFLYIYTPKEQQQSSPSDMNKRIMTVEDSMAHG